MPIAYLHIGAPKCASSLIQGLLNEPDAREILSPEYLPDVCRVTASHTPVWDADDYHTQAMLAQINELMPKKDISLSVENLFGMHTHRDNSCGETAKALPKLFKGFDLKIFMYVRRQDGYIESIYGQDVKRQETREFDEYFSEMHLENLKWDAVCDTYKDFDLTVVPFETKVLNTGGYRDFIDALFTWLGAKVEVENLPQINPSLTKAGHDIQMLANRTLARQEAYDLSIWLEKRCAKKPGEKIGFLKEDLSGFYRESNERLFAEYMPGFDPSHYLESWHG